MGKTKSRLIAVGGLVAGALTLNALRKRRTTEEEPEQPVVEEALHETVTEEDTATDHATYAVEHARVAGEKALESLREERPQQAK